MRQHQERRRRRAATALALGLAAMLAAPLVPAEWNPNTIYARAERDADDHVAWGNHPSKGPGPQLRRCTFEMCWDMGYGWVRWQFDLRGPDGKPFDRVRVFVDDDQWFAGGHCIYTLERVGGGARESESAGCHATNGRAVEEVIHWRGSVPSGTYQLTVWCEDSCDHTLYGVEVWGVYEYVGAHVWSHSTTYEVLPLRADSATPETCVEVSAEGSPAHDTVVRIDWGDGNVETLARGPRYDGTPCHPYLASAIRYQVCLETRELDGWQRTARDCRDVPGGVQL